MRSYYPMASIREKKIICPCLPLSGYFKYRPTADNTLELTVTESARGATAWFDLYPSMLVARLTGITKYLYCRGEDLNPTAYVEATKTTACMKLLSGLNKRTQNKLFAPNLSLSPFCPGVAINVRLPQLHITG